MKYLLLPVCAVLAASPANAQTDEGHIYGGVISGIASTSPDYHELSDPNMARNPAMSGPTAGAVAGFDFKAGDIIIGAEADMALLHNKAPHDPAGANWYTSFNAKWNAHVRGRLGLDVGPATRIYVAGGVAYLKMVTDDMDPEWSEVTKTHTGWSAGGGLEHRIGRKLWLRAEYLHDDYRSRTGTIDYQGSPIYDFTTNPSTDSFRIGMVYRF